MFPLLCTLQVVKETRVDTPDSHGERLRRVREALQRDSLLPGVHAATLIQTPKVVTVERPTLWGAVGVEQSEPVLEWLTSIASAIQEPVEFHGSRTSASEALRMGLAARRMRSWGISCTEQLTTWLRSHGFPATRPGHHISARAQDFIIHEACTADARAALLETVFVLITLHQGRGVPPETRASRTATRRTASAVPSEVLGRCSEQVDQVNLAEWFLKRIPMLETSSLPSRKVAAVFHCGRPQVRQRPNHATRQLSGARQRTKFAGDKQH